MFLSFYCIFAESAGNVAVRSSEVVFTGNMRVLALKRALAWFLVSVLRYCGLWLTFQFPLMPVIKYCTLLFAAPLWLIFVLWYSWIFSLMWFFELLVVPISLLRVSPIFYWRVHGYFCCLAAFFVYSVFHIYSVFYSSAF